MVQKGKPDMEIPEPMDHSLTTFVNFFSKEQLTKDLENAEFSVISFRELKYDDPDHLTDAVFYVLARKK